MSFGYKEILTMTDRQIVIAPQRNNAEKFTKIKIKFGIPETFFVNLCISKRFKSKIKQFYKLIKLSRSRIT